MSKTIQNELIYLWDEETVTGIFQKLKSQELFLFWQMKSENVPILSK